MSQVSLDSYPGHHQTLTLHHTHTHIQQWNKLDEGSKSQNLPQQMKANPKTYSRITKTNPEHKRKIGVV